MKIVICLDKNKGYMFFGKRQSQDPALIKDLEEYLNGETLKVSDYSAKLFKDSGIKQEIVENYNGEGIFFVENLSLPETVDEALVYYWNRDYPYDKTFDLNAYGDFRCVEKKEFKGVGHNKITRKTFKRKD